MSTIMNTYMPVRMIIRKNFQNRSCLSCVWQEYSTKSKVQIANNSAVNDAEKVVGYPTSFLSLRWLLNDEAANIALHLRKLIGVNHPLINTARDLIFNTQSPTWGLIVLLVSKAGGIIKEVSQIEYDITAGILHSQRVLAEVTDMIRMSNLMHKSMLSIKPDDSYFADLTVGNKLSLLTGDYLLSTSFKELATLGNHDVNQLVSSCLRDLSEVQFIEPTDKQNKPLPAAPLEEHKDIIVPNQADVDDLLKISETLGNAKAEWTLRHLLDGASLLAKCCQGTLILAGHPESFNKLGYLFGRNMALAWQARRDEEIFEHGRTGPFSLVCAPVLFHIQHDPSYYKKILEYAEKDDMNFCDIRKAVLAGPGLKKTADLQEEFVLNALEVLEEFPDSEARTALCNIVNTM